MQGWHTTFLGMRGLPRDISDFEMKAFFTFDGAERDAINARRGDSHKLGLALHIGFLRMSGRLLGAFRVIPVALWRHLGNELGIAAPEVASLRAMYERGRTLFDHQQVACTVLGFQWMSEHQRRSLVRELRDEVARCADRDQLLVRARQWLYKNKLVIVHERAIRTLIAAALAQLEVETGTAIAASVDPATLDRWRASVSELRQMDKPSRVGYGLHRRNTQPAKSARYWSASTCFTRWTFISTWQTSPISSCAATRADLSPGRPQPEPRSKSQRAPWRSHAFFGIACSPPQTS